MRGELEAEENCNILTPTLMVITAFLSCSPGLLNWGPGGPASLGHVPHSSIFTLTGLNFLSLGLYNNLMPTLLPASFTISHSIQPLDTQGYILIFLDIYTGAFPILTAWPCRRSICNKKGSALKPKKGFKDTIKYLKQSGPMGKMESDRSKWGKLIHKSIESFDIYIYIYIYIRVGWFSTFFLNIKKNDALKVVYIPIKYSYKYLYSFQPLLSNWFELPVAGVI